MCCYMTSGSLNPAVSCEAARLRLGRSAFRSLAEPHHSSSWKAARPAHMWIYMSGDAEKHPHAQTEIQQGKGKHTNAYIYVFHAYIYFHINQTYLLERFTYEYDLFCTSSRTNPQKNHTESQPMKYLITAAPAKYHDAYCHITFYTLSIASPFFLKPEEQKEYQAVFKRCSRSSPV